MPRVWICIAAALLAAAVYLAAWPVPVDPVAWSAPTAPGYQGVHATNQRLAKLEHLSLDGDEGPEHVVVRDEAGKRWVWMAVARVGDPAGRSGRIVRISEDGSTREVVFDSVGRPLGFDFDAQGALIVADPMWGQHGALLRITGRGANHRVEVLADSVGGNALRYVDAVVVAPSGLIYFTDASQRFGAKASGGTFEAGVLDILEHRCTGRLLEHDPAQHRTRVMLNGLCFPNGVALSADHEQLFVAETGEYRIWKVSVRAQGLDARTLAAAPIEQARVLIANLPGFPDNIMRGREGRLWVGLTKPRGAFVDDNAPRPWLRAMALRLPKALWPVPPAYGHVFAFDESGRVLADLQDPSGAYPETTSVTETEDRLYVQSLHAKTLAVLPRKSAGF